MELLIVLGVLFGSLLLLSVGYTAGYVKGYTTAQLHAHERIESLWKKQKNTLPL